MTGFTNKVLYRKGDTKPRIVFIKGFWRVSPLANKLTITQHQLWKKAHAYIHILNVAISDERASVMAKGRNPQ